MSANQRQVGGNHYQSNLQHWDYVVANNLDYFQAQITKYVTRWKRKGGIRDLEKAQHFLEKYIEVARSDPEFCMAESMRAEEDGNLCPPGDSEWPNRVRFDNVHGEVTNANQQERNYGGSTDWAPDQWERERRLSGLPTGGDGQANPAACGGPDLLAKVYMGGVEPCPPSVRRTGGDGPSLGQGYRPATDPPHVGKG